MSGGTHDGSVAPIQPESAVSAQNTEAIGTTSVTSLPSDLAIYEPPERGLLYGAIVVVSLVAAALAGFLWWQAASRADIAFDGKKITNAQVMIEQAEVLYRQVMEADGATLTGEERCVFAGRNDVLDLVCGPGWLRSSAPEQPWLEMSLGFDFVGESVEGTVTGVEGPIEADMRTFNRPDGKKAASPGEAVYSTLGPRTTSGRLVSDPAAAVSAADAAFAEAMSVPSPLALTVHPDARCFLVESITDDGVAEYGDQALCGPMRTFDSTSDQQWAPVAFGWTEGDIYGVAVIDTADAFYKSTDENFSLSSVPDGSILTRPDGVAPESADTVDYPPRLGDFTEVVEGGGGESLVGFGRLNTESELMTFSGFGRVGRIGAGSNALIAAPGHEFVVARHRGSEGSFFQPRGVLIVDGVERPLPPTWSVTDGFQLLIVSVPVGTGPVSLMIENDGRPQTISLEDGTLESGFPQALYREPVEINRAIASRVEMPAGEAVLVSGKVLELSWSGRDVNGAWLPAGQSRLDVDIEAFVFDTPCCDVVVTQTATSIVLIDPASGEELPDARLDSSTGPPSFLVDESIDAVTLRFDFTVDIEVEGEAQQEFASSDIEVTLP